MGTPLGWFVAFYWNSSDIVERFSSHIIETTRTGISCTSLASHLARLFYPLPSISISAHYSNATHHLGSRASALAYSPPYLSSAISYAFAS
ncbi:hypothetical protein H9Q73_006928 [Fusarium xylarioides]|nr:hypothetical protein H9Q73_006928 [Fusarium xylarioides]